MARPKRPSEPLLALLRKTAQDRGLNTAALAEKAELDRSHLKHVLSGREPLTVDELIVLAQVLELDPGNLAGIEAAEEDEPEEGPVAIAPVTSLATARIAEDGGEGDPIGAAADPYGNHIAQILRLGLALGTDMHLVLEASEVQESGVPPQVLSKFPERLPLRLDAAYHRHHDLRFLPGSVRMKLSFDSLYDCEFPWSSILQVTLFPLAPDDEPEPEEEPVEEPEGTIRRGHLRLVE